MKNTPEEIKKTTCDTIETLLGGYACNELSAEETERLEAHLAHCDACREALEDIRRVLQLLATGIEREDRPVLSEAFHQRIAGLPAARSRKKRILFFPGTRVLLQVAAVLVCLGVVWAFLIPGLFKAHNRARTGADEITLAQSDKGWRRGMEINVFPHGMPKIALEEPMAEVEEDETDGRELDFVTRLPSRMEPIGGDAETSEMDLAIPVTPTEELSVASGVTAMDDALHSLTTKSPMPSVYNRLSAADETAKSRESQLQRQGQNARDNTKRDNSAWYADSDMPANPQPDLPGQHKADANGAILFAAPVQPPPTAEAGADGKAIALAESLSFGDKSKYEKKALTVDAKDQIWKESPMRENGTLARKLEQSSVLGTTFKEAVASAPASGRVAAAAKPGSAPEDIAVGGFLEKSAGERSIREDHAPAGTVAQAAEGDTRVQAEKGLVGLDQPVAITPKKQAERERLQPFSLSNAYSGEAFTPSVFRQVRVNPFQMAGEDNLSTFALDTDTASYRIAQNYLRNSQLPPPGAIRMEEFVNNFSYNYPRGDNTFNIHVQGAPSPFRKDLMLLKIGVQGRILGREARKTGRFVFLIDTSGSMARSDRMPLVIYSMELLLGQLSERDTLSVVTYGPQPRLILDAVSPKEKERILETLRAIQCGGSTNLFEGVKLAYTVAEKQFQATAVNRIVLLSDGATNVGPTDAEDLQRQVAANRRQGINFTSIGFGMGNYNDDILESLANKGDGSYVFVGTAEEARKALVEDMSATIQYIAKDAKIQVEFDKNRVRRYRLIGYENRDIADRDFRNDTVDAGEVGSGKSATALYEVELLPETDPEVTRDIGTVYVRYRNMETNTVEEVSRRITPADIRPRTVKDSPHYYLAACAAEFAEQLRRSEYVQSGNLGDVRHLLEQVAAELPLDNQVRELVRDVALAEKLSAK